MEAKTLNTNLTWLYIYVHVSVQIQFIFFLYSMIFCNRFVFECFVPSIHYFWKTVPTKLLTSLCWQIYTKFRFFETLTVINSVNWILFIETLYKFRTSERWFIKTTEYLQYEGCFAFNRAANAKESRLCERERNFLREAHVHSRMKRSQYLILGRVWVGT